MIYRKRISCQCGGLFQAEESRLLDDFLSDTDWRPDSSAVEDPAHYRINAWEKTSLGTETMMALMTAMMMIKIVVVIINTDKHTKPFSSNFLHLLGLASCILKNLLIKMKNINMV